MSRQDEGPCGREESSERKEQERPVLRGMWPGHAGRPLSSCVKKTARGKEKVSVGATRAEAGISNNAQFWTYDIDVGLLLAPQQKKGRRPPTLGGHVCHVAVLEWHKGLTSFHPLPGKRESSPQVKHEEQTHCSGVNDRCTKYRLEHAP